MKNPYFNLIKAVWHYGFQWRSQIIGYYIAFITAQVIWSLGPYAFGQAGPVQDLWKSYLESH